MSDPRLAQIAQTIAQEGTRKMVERVVTDNLHGVKDLTQVEERFVQAVYHPDRRLG